MALKPRNFSINPIQKLAEQLTIGDKRSSYKYGAAFPARRGNVAYGPLLDDNNRKELVQLAETLSSEGGLEELSPYFTYFSSDIQRFTGSWRSSTVIDKVKRATNIVYSSQGNTSMVTFDPPTGFLDAGVALANLGDYLAIYRKYNGAVLLDDPYKRPYLVSTSFEWNGGSVVGHVKGDARYLSGLNADIAIEFIEDIKIRIAPIDRSKVDIKYDSEGGASLNFAWIEVL